jgi:hypothetical protein
MRPQLRELPRQHRHTSIRAHSTTLAAKHASVS